VILILEGPDGSGKSTRAKQLLERYNLEDHHEGPPPKDVPILVHYGAQLEKARHKSIVFDRFAFGERVYGHVLRNHDRLGEDGWRVFKRLLRSTCAMSVVCLPSYDVCYANWLGRKGELFKDSDLLRKTYDRYVEVMDYEEHYEYDYTQPEAFETLCCGIDMEMPQLHPLPARVIGSPSARTLLVGDRGGDPTYGVDLPFFGTIESSAYLNKALAIADIPESSLAFVNAFSHELNDYEILPKTFPNIVALGQAAERMCIEQGLQPKRVPHPQYWRRFHHADIYTYAAMLREACQ
jgi:hypothetical protein